MEKSISLRQSFENRDTANNQEWETLKDGHYPFLERDREAVQKAVERRVSGSLQRSTRSGWPNVNENRKRGKHGVPYAAKIAARAAKGSSPAWRACGWVLGDVYR